MEQITRVPDWAVAYNYWRMKHGLLPLHGPDLAKHPEIGEWRGTRPDCPVSEWVRVAEQYPDVRLSGVHPATWMQQQYATEEPPPEVVEAWMTHWGDMNYSVACKA
jgi:hypothetical protein